MRIVVTGSVGNISGPIVSALTKSKKHEVVVITSSSERKAEIEALGAIPAVGSVLDKAFLEGVVEGADAVYAMMPPLPSLMMAVKEDFNLEFVYKLGETLYGDSLSGKGIKKVVLLSSFGADRSEDIGALKYAHIMEQSMSKLLEEGTNVTFLRPCEFYTNLYRQIPAMKEGKIISVVPADVRQFWVSPVDIAKVAVEELQKTELSTGRSNVRYVVSEVTTGADIAKIIGKAIGKTLTWTCIDDEVLVAQYMGYGMSKDLATGMKDMYVAIRNGKIAEDLLRNMPAELGSTKLKSFAQDLAKVYNS